MFGSRIRWLLAIGLFVLSAAAPTRESDAFFRWFRRWWYGSAYVYPTGYSTYAAQYVPQTSYRQQCSYVPVTTYQPVTTVDACTGCPVTTYRPVVVYRPQVTLVPYTSYRIVYTPAVSPAGTCVIGAPSYGTVLYQPSASCCAPGAAYAAGVPTDSYAPPSATLPYDSGGTQVPGSGSDTGPIPTYEEGSQPESSSEQRLRPIPDKESEDGSSGDGAPSDEKAQQEGTSGHPRLIDPDSTTAQRRAARPWSYSRIIWPARQPAPVHAAGAAEVQQRPASSSSQLDDGGWRPSRR